LLDCTDQIPTLRFGDRHRLFNEDVLSSPKCLQSLGRVELIAAGDQNRVNGRIFQDALKFGRAILTTIPGGDAFSSRPT